MALGYLNRPDLTEQKFVANPFHPEWKMYRTGDSGIFLPDGNIEIIGRIDNQVKLRGFRVELGEIDSALMRHSSVKEVLTLVVESEGNKLLVACILIF